VEPAGVVTTTSTVPDPAGDVAAIDVAEVTVKARAGVRPKETEVVPVKFEPVMMTEVPPEAVPEAGASPVTAGGDPAPQMTTIELEVA
jgi:hypothetical protein